MERERVGWDPWPGLQEGFLVERGGRIHLTYHSYRDSERLAGGCTTPGLAMKEMCGRRAFRWGWRGKLGVATENDPEEAA